MKKYKVGIIGCGRIAGLLEDDALRGYPCTHMGGYLAHPKVEVVSCCSRTCEDAHTFGKRFNIPNVYSDYNHMLASEKLDIVSVAAYAPTRCEMVTAAAHSGVKAIFCEKAMATTLAEAELMISACQENGVVLCVNHTRRWDHHYIGAKELIDSGALGTLHSISGTFSGNVLHTGIHMFDAMIYFAGNIEAVSGNLREHDARADVSSGYQFSDEDEEDIGEAINDYDGHATLYFKNGTIGHVLGIGKKYFIFELDIQGSRGRIRIGNNLFEYWDTETSTHYSDFNELRLKSKTISGKRPPGMVLAVCDIIEALEKGTKVRCDGYDARLSLECALSVYESHAKNGQKIFLPLKNKQVRVVSR